MAQIGSAAVAKSVRRAGRKLIAVGCHYDVIDWLDPDWIVEMPSGTFTRRLLRRRPAIELEIVRVDKAAWTIFRQSHYLSGSLHAGSKCFAALYAGRPVAFTAVLFFPHNSRPGWREHRTVCLSDFQGIGIGNRMSEFVAGLFAATGKPYRSVTANPAMVAHRCKSKNWKMTRKPSINSHLSSSGKTGQNQTQAINRFTTSFEYVGQPNYEAAKLFDIV